MTPQDLTMAVPKRKEREQHTTVRAPNSDLVHAMTLTSQTTACGRTPKDWLVVPALADGTARVVNCRRCLALIYYPVRPRRRGQRS